MPCWCAEGCDRKVAYAGNRCKACANRTGRPCDPLWKAKAHNAINNPINNPINTPIYNARRRERLREQWRRYMREQGFREAALSDTDIAEVVNRIAQDGNLVPAFHGQSLDELMRERKHAIYIGETGRELHDEDLRFLTARGGMDGRGRNRPVLLWPDNKTTITMGQARKELGFQSAFVYESMLKGNANMVEDGLQSRYHDTTVLPVRLWRAIGCGNHGFKQQRTDNDRVHKVYVTFSKTALEKVAEGELFVDL